MRIRLWLLLVFLLLLVHPGQGAQERQRPDWRRWLKDRELSGCLVIHDERNQTTHASDQAECRKGHIPASTSKIFNALAGLESGVLKDRDHKIEWDKERRGFPEWNQDHTLKTAMSDSAIWYFQATAREVGLDRIRAYMKKIGYGNQNLRAGVDQWWLWGPFEITPYQQIDFLSKLSRGRLPFKKKAQADALAIMFDSSGQGYELYGRSGILTVKKTEVWWVGLVRRPLENKHIYFALFYEPEESLVDPDDDPGKYGCELSLLKKWQKENESRTKEKDFKEREAKVRESLEAMQAKIKGADVERLTQAELQEKDRQSCMEEATRIFRRKRSAFYGARRELVLRALKEIQAL